jgi:hypothetical protein
MEVEAGYVHAGKPTSGRVVAAVSVALVAAVFGLAALWYTSVFDDYQGSCKFDGSAAVGDPDVGRVNIGGAPASTPEEAIARFAAHPGASASGTPVPADGWHENRGLWVHDLPDGRFLQIATTKTDQGWVVSSAVSCGRA